MSPAARETGAIRARDPRARHRLLCVASAVAAGLFASATAASTLVWQRINEKGLHVAGRLFLGPAYRGAVPLDEERYVFIAETRAVEVRRRDGNGLLGCGPDQSYGPVRSLPFGVVSVRRHAGP